MPREKEVPRLDDLIKTVDAMSQDELYALQRQIRSGRKINKKLEVKRERKQKSDGEKVLGQIKKMTPEQAAALMKALQGGGE